VDWTQGGATVNIEGLGFGETGTPVVKFGTVNATNVVRVSITLVTATVPASTVGAKEVSVTPVGGTAIKKANAFTYKAPVINSIQPNSGVVLGGTNVKIMGDGFGLIGTPVVKFGGKLATNIVRVDNFTITATTPSGVKGFTPVEVTPQGGTAISNSTVYAYFELQVAPQLDASSLTWLPPAGGVPVTVTGSNFQGTDGKPGKVYIAGTLVAATVSADGRSVTFTPPALAPSGGAYEFRITTNEGSAWRNIFRVALGPTGPAGGCDVNTAGGRNMDGGGSRTIYLNNGALLLGELGNPTVTVNGTESPIIVAGNTGGQSPRDFVTFSIPTEPALALGAVSVVVKLGQNAGSVTNDCFSNIAYLTVQANSKTIIFGQDPGAFTWAAAGERNSDKVISALLTFTGIDGSNYPTSTTVPTAAGRYQIRPSSAVMSPGDLSKYRLDYLDGVFVIQGIPVVVTAIQCTTKVYGDPNPNISYSVTGLPESESVKAGSVTYIYEGYRNTGDYYGPTTVMPTRAGEYTITPRDAVLNSANTPSISFSYESCNYVITKRPVSIEAVDTQKFYGSQDPAKTWTFLDPSNKNLAPGDSNLAGSAIVDRYPGENVGDYNYVPASLDDENPDYEITYSYWGKLTINKKPIDVTGVNSTKNYCQPDPAFLYTSAGLVGDDKLSGYLSRVQGNNIGNYAYTAGTLDGGNNYTISSISGGQLTITTCPLAVKADEESKIYGEEDPTLDYYFDGDYGLQFDDVMTGTLTRVAGSNIGEYTINRGSLAASANYSVTYTSNKFTIYKRPLCLAADNKSKVYGDADPAFTSTLITNSQCYSLIGSDAITGTLSRETGENAGYYDITPGTVTAGNNYELSVSSGELEITKRPITITPAAKSKTYGEDDPALTISVTAGALVGADSLTGSIDRAGNENAGEYDFILGDFGNANPNYEITVDNVNKFTINKKRITVTGVDTQKYYGDADPELDYTSTGLVGSDRLTGALDRAPGENVGNYNYTSGDLAGGDNYILDSVTGGKLVVLPKSVDVCAEDKSMIYGESRPANTSVLCAESELVGSDAFGSSTLTYSTADPVNAGSYGITPSAAVLTSGDPANYAFNYVAGTLTIGKRLVKVTADDKQKTYGQADPTFTYNITEGTLVGSDAFTGTLSRDNGENVGDYNVTLGSLTLGDNYEVELLGGKLTINKLAIRVIPSPNQKKSYGDNDPDYDFTTNIVLPFSDALDGGLGRDSGEDVAPYAYTLGDLVDSNPNYEITLDTANKFNIEKLVITVSVNDMEKFYGEADPQFTFTSAPATLGNGGTITLTGSPTRLPGENVGEYLIAVGTLTAGPNYTATISVGAKLTIKKAPITITAGSHSVVYGSANPANTFSLTAGKMGFSETVSGVTYTYSTNPPRNVGSYDITPSAAVISGGVASNYEITYVKGELVITKAALTIYLANSNSDWGDPVRPAGAGSSEGLVNGDKLGTFNFTFDGSATQPAMPGTYALDGTVSTFAAGTPDNYEITIVPATYTINSPFFVSIEPSRGPVAGGTRFTINGFGFGFNNPIVRFDGLDATEVALNGSTQITGVTPPHAEGLVNVTLVTDAGTLEFGEVYTYYPPKPTPQITALAPVKGTTAGGTKVTMTGSAFKGSDGKVANIYVNGVLATGVKVSKDGKTVEFITPPNTQGLSDIRVATKDGSFTYADAFEYIPGAKSSKAVIIFDGDKSVLLQPAIATLNKLLKGIPKGANIVSVSVNGWVKRTASTAIDAKLSLARATVTASFLKKAGIKAKIVTNGKGIYRLGNDQDRRAEIEITWVK
jgi:outer membrane protein OmpA-like peptidoglycan-associated protein